MEPENLRTTSNPVEADLKQSVAIEYAAKTLMTEVNLLLRKRKSGEIDENEAKRLRKSLDQLLNDPGAETVKLDGLLQSFEKLREQIHSQVESRNTAYHKIESALETLDAAVKSGDLKVSQQLEQSIFADLNRMKGLSSQRRQKIITEVEKLQPKIQKLSAWRKWGTVQAREKIIAEIKQLHDHEKDLEKVANRIKQARQQWQKWDRSGEGGDHKLYQAFDQACSEAYKPCKEKFNVQRKQRQAASRHRLAICTLLEKKFEEIDWRKPDWKEIQIFTREQSIRWGKLPAADFKDRKTLQQQYDQVFAKFSGPMGRERERNFKGRKGLVEEIVKLSNTDDSRNAVAALQPLKKRWKVTVSSGRREEQAIWKIFTEACDRIYQKHRKDKKEIDQRLETNFKHKQDLCRAFEKSLQSNFSDPSMLIAMLSNWKNSWMEVGKVPGKRINEVESKYNTLIKTAKERLKTLQRQQQKLLDQRLFDYAAICAQTEACVISSTGCQIPALISQWAEVGEIDKSIEQLIQKRFDTAIRAAEDEKQKRRLIKDLSENFEQVNQYLLQLEISCEVESPEKYAKQRMALQIGRLSMAMGKSASFEKLPDQTLVQKIHTIGAIDPALQSSVNDRFKTCYEKIQHDHH